MTKKTSRRATAIKGPDKLVVAGKTSGVVLRESQLGQVAGGAGQPVKDWTTS